MRRALFALLVIVALSPSNAIAAGDPGLSQQWGMNKIGAPSVWQKATGKDIIVAVIDTGVDLEHEDLKGKILPGRDFLDPGTPPQDENGHGTHVAGISAAITFNNRGVAGVAPDAKILPARILNAFGFDVQITLLEEERAAAAVRWAVDNGAKVINMSFGGASEGPGEEVEQAIRYAWANGAICVIAAGNDDGSSSGYTDEPALVVVATEPNDTRARYSNIADKANWGISAPGSSVYSTYYDFVLAPNDHSNYDTLSGTSMAAPHVSGAVAVLRSMGLNPQQTVDALLRSAVDLGSAGPDPIYGAGRLDLAAAVASVDSAGGSGPGGTRQNKGGTASGGASEGKSNGSKSASGGPATAESPATAGTESTAGPQSAQERAEASHNSRRGPSPMAINLIIGGILVASILAAVAWSRIRASRVPID